MKNCFNSLLLLLFFLASLQAAEVEKPIRNMAVTVNPLAMVFLKPSIDFQLGVTHKIALVFPLRMQFLTGTISINKGPDLSANVFGVGTGIGAKLFITGQAFEDSLYIQPMVIIGWLGVDKESFVMLSGSLLAGYGWVFNSGFSLNIGLGIQYIYTNVQIKSSVPTVAFNGLFPDAEFSLGYSW
ncbi:MAG: hypothetical protein WCK42_03125 [Myxococcaceae bacterium]